MITASEFRASLQFLSQSAIMPDYPKLFSHPQSESLFTSRDLPALYLVVTENCLKI